MTPYSVDIIFFTSFFPSALITFRIFWAHYLAPFRQYYISNLVEICAYRMGFTSLCMSDLLLVRCIALAKQVAAACRRSISGGCLKKSALVDKYMVSQE